MPEWYSVSPLAQVFSCEFCQISKNTFYNRIPPVAASEQKKVLLRRKLLLSRRQGTLDRISSVEKREKASASALVRHTKLI